MNLFKFAYQRKQFEVLSHLHDCKKSFDAIAHCFPETMRKLCLSTKLSEITAFYAVFVLSNSGQRFKRTSNFLTHSRGIDKEHWHKIG